MIYYYLLSKDVLLQRHNTVQNKWKSLILFKLAYQLRNVWCTDLIICKVYLWCDSSILGKLASRTVLAATVVLELWLKLYNLLPQPENENFLAILRFQYFFLSIIINEPISGNSVCLECTFNFCWQLFIADSYTSSEPKLPLINNQSFIFIIK